jgi:hypothetical protein
VTERAGHPSSPIGRLLGPLSVLSALLLAVVYSLRRTGDSDLWHHLRCGEEFLKAGSIVRTYAFNAGPTSDRPFLNHEWLFQALVAAVEGRSGEMGLIALQVALVLAAFGILFLTVRLVSSNLSLIGLVLGLGIAASSHRFALRPQHVSTVFLALLLAVLHLYQRGDRRWAWALPPMMLVWINVHAECLFGLVIPALFLAVEGWKARTSGSLRALSPLAAALGLSAVAALANPFGAKTIVWPLLVMGEMRGRVEELLPPASPRFLFFWAYCLLAAIAIGVTLVRRPRRVDPTWGLLSALFLVVAWSANRGIPHFVLVSAPLVVACLDGWIQEANFPRAVRLAGLVLPPTAMGALALLVVRDPRYLLPHDGVAYPDGALRFLKTHRLTGGILGEHRWGGYLLWEGRPGLRPFLDGRFYLRRDFEELEALRAARPGWQRVLRERGVGLALLGYPDGAPPWLADALFADPDWALVQWDDVGRLYVERTAHPEVFEQFGNRLVDPDRQLLDLHEGKSPEVVVRIRALTGRDAREESLSWRARILAGNAAFAAGDAAEAAVHYEAAAALLDPPNAWIRWQAARCRLAQGDLPRAEAHIRATLALSPGFQDAVRALADLERRRAAPAPAR